MQLFPRSLNALPVVAGLGAAVGGAVVTGAIWYYFSAYNLAVGYAPEQPVPYSHKLHAGDLGIDCRYCHANVERSYEAMVPPTQTCMGCHAVIKTDSPKLAPVRDSWASGKPIEWQRIHRLPDHVYFDHSVHLAAGVGCESCHGRIDQMEVVRQDQPLSMSWCLDCHRDPAARVRNPEDVFNLDSLRLADQGAEGAKKAKNFVEHAKIMPPQSCTGCHR